jgi:hypothetical protein
VIIQLYLLTNSVISLFCSIIDFCNSLFWFINSIINSGLICLFNLSWGSGSDRLALIVRLQVFLCLHNEEIWLYFLPHSHVY